MEYLRKKQDGVCEIGGRERKKVPHVLFSDQRESSNRQLQQQKAMQLHSGANVIQRLQGMADKDFIKKHGHKFEDDGWDLQELEADLKRNSGLTEDQYLDYRNIKKSNRKEKDEDKTYGGARLIGDSNALALSKFNSKTRAIDFKKWKKGKEAQHLVPASIAKKNKILAGIIDRKRNAIMLPSIWKSGIKKPVHRQPKHRDHAAYTKNVRIMVAAVQKSLGVKSMTRKQWKRVMDALRVVNKLPSYRYIDKIPYSEFQKAWNSGNLTQI